MKHHEHRSAKQIGWNRNFEQAQIATHWPWSMGQQARISQQPGVAPLTGITPGEFGVILATGYAVQDIDCTQNGTTVEGTDIQPCALLKQMICGRRIRKLGSVNKDCTAVTSMPRTDLNCLSANHDQASPRLPDGETSQGYLPGLPDGRIQDLNWGNAKPPSAGEMSWITSFGAYPDFDPTKGRMSKRLTLEIADLKLATRIIVYHHYLHRGRTMAQLPYWIVVDGIQVGVVLFSLPRLSVPLDGIGPMNILELARMWVSPDVQDQNIVDAKGKTHALSVASCAIGKALRSVAVDWNRRYPRLPDVRAVVSWADDEHHEGTIYKAANFRESGKSGGSMHGNRRRPNGGRDQHNTDYTHIKTRFLYVLDDNFQHSEPLTQVGQVALFDWPAGLP